MLAGVEGVLASAFDVDLRLLLRADAAVIALTCAATLAHKGWSDTPVRPLILLLLATGAAQAARRRSPHARDASSGLVLGGCMAPLLFAAEDGPSSGAASAGFVITWLTALFVCSLHVARTRALAGACCAAALCAVAAALHHLTAARAAAAYAAAAAAVYGALLRALPKTFTEGECLVLAQQWALLAYAVVGHATGHVALTKLRVVMSYGAFGALLLAAAVLLLRRAGVRSGAVYAAVVPAGMAAVLAQISAALGENSLVWLWGYLTAHRAAPMKLCLYFAVVAVAGVRLAPTRFRQESRTIARKYFHALALFMFVPAILVHVRFVALAFSVAFSVFVVVESLRISGVEPVSSAVDSVMKAYIDEKDGGAAVITHTYLLLGCAVPVWYIFVSHHGGIFSARSLLSAVAGLTVTGLGDACASVMGVLFGRQRWSGFGVGESKKTVEGSLAMITSILLFQYAALCVYGFQGLSGASWAKLVLSDVLVVFLEASTDQVDNLLLPLCHLVTLQML